MDKDSEYVSWLLDTLQSVGPVTGRRMFGGYGIFIDGLMFGLVADNVFYLKVDDESVEAFRAQGLQPFLYHKQGKPVKLSYYQAPDEALESSEQMQVWANKGVGAALRAAKTGRKSKASES